MLHLDAERFVGDPSPTSADPGALDLSGTVVSTTCDKKIAVFGGNGRCVLGTAGSNPTTGINCAGGTTDWSGTVLSNRVDIYDASMNSWSTTVLPNAAAGIVPGSVGNKILLPRKSNSVDIYDVASNTWSVSNLNETIWASASITVNNKAMFVSSIGGSNPVYSSSSKHVNIYNAANSTWSLDSLNQFNVLDPIPRSFFGAATAGNFSVFITTLQRYLVYDGSNNTWAMTPDTHYEFKGLPSIISANNKIYITDAGGLWKVQL